MELLLKKTFLFVHWSDVDISHVEGFCVYICIYTIRLNDKNKQFKISNMGAK